MAEPVLGNGCVWVGLRGGGLVDGGCIGACTRQQTNALEAVDGEDDDAEDHGEEEEPHAEPLELLLQRRLGRGALPVLWWWDRIY